MIWCGVVFNAIFMQKSSEKKIKIILDFFLKIWKLCLKAPKNFQIVQSLKNLFLKLYTDFKYGVLIMFQIASVSLKLSQEQKLGIFQDPAEQTTGSLRSLTPPDSPEKRLDCRWKNDPAYWNCG